MYIVINKKTKEVLHTDMRAASLDLPDKEVYESFSKAKMVILKTDESIPAHFKIDANNQIVEMTPAEIVETDASNLDDLLGPYVEAGDIAELKSRVSAILKGKYLSDPERCQRLLNLLNRGLSQRIAQEYDMSYEMKITKDYISWMQEGSPAKDLRSERYESMQAFINNEKKGLKKLKDQIKKLQKKLETAT